MSLFIIRPNHFLPFFNSSTFKSKGGREEKEILKMCLCPVYIMHKHLHLWKVSIDRADLISHRSDWHIKHKKSLCKNNQLSPNRVWKNSGALPPHCPFHPERPLEDSSYIIASRRWRLPDTGTDTKNCTHAQWSLRSVTMEMAELKKLLEWIDCLSNPSICNPLRGQIKQDCSPHQDTVAVLQWLNIT